MGNLKRKRSGKFYYKNENETMKKLGLTPTKGSGNGWLEKEDGLNDEVIAQLKSTDANSIKISLEDLNKLNYNAKVDHKAPLFVIQFLSTGELFILMKPQDATVIVNSLFNNKASDMPILEPTNSDHLINIKPVKKRNKKVTIKSGDKINYWEERTKQYEKAKGKFERRKTQWGKS